MRNKKVLWLFISLGLIYVALLVLIPPQSAALTRYKISADEIRLIRLGVALPLICVWFLAFYGWSKFQNYAEHIAKSKDGKAFSRFTRGLLILALWLPVTTIANNIATAIYTDKPDLTPAMVIANNYFNLLMLLVAFFYMHQGAQKLAKISLSVRSWPFAKSLLGVVFIITGSLFVYLTLANPARQFPPDNLQRAAYYLPDWLLVPTIIIPYLVIFYLGFQVVQNMHTYSSTVKGVLYKSALRYLANGIGAVVLTLLTLRYLTSFTTLLNDAALKAILLIVYLLILVIAAGFILIAFGAKKLHRIEEV